MSSERVQRKAPPPLKGKRRGAGADLTGSAPADTGTGNGAAARPAPAPNERPRPTAPAPAPAAPDAAPAAPAAPASTPTPPAADRAAPTPEPAPAAPAADAAPAPSAPARPTVAERPTGTVARRAPAPAPPAPAPGADDTWSKMRMPSVPDGVPDASELFTRRWVEREPLNASVPVVLRLNDRIDALLMEHDMYKVPVGDVVAVAMDWWLRGRIADRDVLGEPWRSCAGPGTPDDIPSAVDVMAQRWIDREPLRSSVPSALRIPYRIRRFMSENRVQRKTPPADVIAVAVDEWLRFMDA